MKKNYIHKLFVLVISVLVIMSCIKVDIVKAAHPLDEILLYSITADVKEDATVDLTYDVSWEVLDSSSEGPLEWVQIGLPNSHINEITGLSDTVSSVNTKNSGGYYAVIYFDRKYYQGEVVNFSFKVNMDYMYQVYPEENLVEYNFTPGWFDNIEVDQLVLRWNSDNIEKFEPNGCLMEDGYHVWTESLSPGEKYSIEITYPIDAYNFDLSVHEEDTDSSYDFSEHSVFANVLFVILCIICFVFMILLSAMPIILPGFVIFIIYKSFSGFTTGSKKITRTIVEYYDSCPNCGGSREEGKEKCSYCGSNMVKSKQEIKEEDIKDSNKDLLDFKTNGEYRYTSNPNTFVRVNVINIPRVTHTPSSSGSGRSHHSSCAHSSCACACACACAGGGRAGCSTKDFYNTDFKLSYLKKFRKEK